MKLKLFGRTQVQKIETTIAALAVRGEQLAAKRTTAQRSSEKAIKARQDALLSGDLDDQRALDKLQAAVDTATSALAGIDDAIGVLAEQKADADSQLIAERERIVRATAAEKLSAQIAAIEAVLPNFLEQSRVFSDALAEIGHMHFETNQMAGFVQNVASQVEIAANFTLAELRTMPNAIRNGTAPIPLPKPENKTVAVIEPAPEAQAARLAPIMASDPASANFRVVDRSAEARTIQIEVPRL